ncbi:hypothetical protein NXC14_PC00224 (plasmid) [Rhizobium sp. NXC14]|nr:hypothetical protein NXC14_PC00224 [Rhizobium sp. NXC14]
MASVSADLLPLNRQGAANVLHSASEPPRNPDVLRRKSGIAVRPGRSARCWARAARGGQGRELTERQRAAYQPNAKTSYTLGDYGIRCWIGIPISVSNLLEDQGHG